MCNGYFVCVTVIIARSDNWTVITRVIRATSVVRITRVIRATSVVRITRVIRFISVVRLTRARNTRIIRGFYLRNTMLIGY